MNTYDNEIPDFTGSETGIYEDARDNYYYEHYMNPNVQYLLWIQKWKKQHLEILENCKRLGQNVQSDEYVKGYLDAICPEFPSTTY
tara:strand:+ start:249 stop:506 length:258 start_codon:yes stop_codon:yes gene_type:complete